MNYSEIARKEIDDTGYGFSGFVSLARRADGLRYRMIYAGFRWTGNEGGYHESAQFGPIDEAREFWHGHFEALSDCTIDEFFGSL